MTKVNPSAESATQPTRRQRARAATQVEIVGAARELLVEAGPDGVTLRAIASRLGMTAPALYRYFDSRELLLAELINTLYGELADQLAAVRDSVALADLSNRYRLTARQFRSWALANRAEFGLLFGAPLPGIPGKGADDAEPDERGQRFGQVWLELFVQLWQQHPLTVPATELNPTLRASLVAYHEEIGKVVPIEALAIYLSCWMQLYGAVATEAFGHLSFALGEHGDAEGLFEQVMQMLTSRLNLKPR